MHHSGYLCMISVDALDLKILAALQDDGRLTNQQLADAIGLSASQCSRRRMRLEGEKVMEDAGGQDVTPHHRPTTGCEFW